MNLTDEFAPDIVNSITNEQLESALRAMLYSSNKSNLNGFIRSLLESTLIVLTDGPPITPEGRTLNIDEEGFAYYAKGTNLKLVQFHSESEGLILPTFTQSAHVHRIRGLSNYHGLAIPAISLLETCIVAETNKLIFNPETAESLEIDRKSLSDLVSQLQISGLLQNETALQKGHIDHSSIS